MKKELPRGFAKTVTTTALAARNWYDRDFPVPATLGKATAAPKHSMHFKILSRTGK